MTPGQDWYAEQEDSTMMTDRDMDDPSPRTLDLERQVAVAMTAPMSASTPDGDILEHFARGLTPRQANRIIKLCRERRRDGGR
jgi:hypothetical protein